MNVSRHLVVLDLETTGTWREKDKIVEIGMIKCRPDGSRQDFVRRINPGILIPPAVSQIIGITNEDVKDEPPFKEAAAAILSFIGDADFAGFNIERFDLPVLVREFNEAGLTLELENRVIYDAQKVYHLHEKRDLTAAYRFYCNKDMDNAHSAQADTQATLEVLTAQIKKYGTPGANIEALKSFNYEQSVEFFDKSGKFHWWNGELYPTFGKYFGKSSIKEIAACDPGYLKWMLTKDFDQEVATLIKAALLGNFPAYPHKQGKD